MTVSARTRLLASGVAILILSFGLTAFADDDDKPAALPAGSGLNSTRFGLWNMLDHRSVYGKDIFPEPMLIDDSDREDSGARFDWLHTKAGPAHSDSGLFQLQQGFGLVTVEFGMSYEHDFSPEQSTHGLGDISLGARTPVFQYVSPSGFFDTTTGVGFTLSIPTTSAVSKNTEILPEVFDDIRLGSHVTLELVLGYSALFGPGTPSGGHLFNYGGMVGYTLDEKDLPLPGVEQLIPYFEVDGQQALNQPSQGLSSLVSDVGVRINFKKISGMEPRLGVGWIFPLNSSTRQDLRTGIIVSVVFDF